MNCKYFLKLEKHLLFYPNTSYNFFFQINIMFLSIKRNDTLHKETANRSEIKTKPKTKHTALIAVKVSQHTTPKNGILWNYCAYSLPHCFSGLKAFRRNQREGKYFSLKTLKSKSSALDHSAKLPPPRVEDSKV